MYQTVQYSTAAPVVNPHAENPLGNGPIVFTPPAWEFTNKAVEVKGKASGMPRPVMIPTAPAFNPTTTIQSGNVAHPRAWVTTPVLDPEAPYKLRPRGFSVSTYQSTVGNSTNWDIKSRYLIAMRSGPTECPDHILCQSRLFPREEFTSPYVLYYFDETAPNEKLLQNDVIKDDKNQKAKAKKATARTESLSSSSSSSSSSDSVSHKHHNVREEEYVSGSSRTSSRTSVTSSSMTSSASSGVSSATPSGSSSSATSYNNPYVRAGSWASSAPGTVGSSVPMLMPTTKSDKDRNTTYTMRRLFVDVDDLRIPKGGSGLKMLPTYSVSYRNYPVLCYDVVAPSNYQDFFRVRKCPGFFS